MIAMDMQAATPEKAGDPCHMAKDKRLVFDVVLGNQRNGVRDMTRHEIRAGFERLYGYHRELGQISATVAKLLRDGRLIQGERRICSTQAGKEGSVPLGTVLIPTEQARMFA